MYIDRVKSKLTIVNQLSNSLLPPVPPLSDANPVIEEYTWPTKNPQTKQSCCSGESKLPNIERAVPGKSYTQYSRDDLRRIISDYYKNELKIKNNGCFALRRSSEPGHIVLVYLIEEHKKPTQTLICVEEREGGIWMKKQSELEWFNIPTEYEFRSKILRLYGLENADVGTSYTK